MHRFADRATSALNFDDAVVALGTASEFPDRVRLESSPALEALRRAGTSHVSVDTASVDEFADLARVGADRVSTEIDGNSVSPPLARRVLEQYLDSGDPRAWTESLRRHRPDISREALLPMLYAVVCGRIGNDFLRRFAGPRSWEVSLQLHMGLCGDLESGVGMGRRLRQIVPKCLVRVPLTPHAPQCLLVARELEGRGVPVDFTSTFSARQVVAAALLTGATRASVLMGRLDAGLEASRLGEHVALEAQRALLALRREHGVRTRLVAANVRDWRSLVRTAGCDVYRAPCEVLEEFMSQQEVGPADLESRIEASYEDELGIADELVQRLGEEAIARLWRVEPELVAFLLDYRSSEEYRELRSGEGLARRFESEGFGDLFHAPDEATWQELRADPLPRLDGPLAGRMALDTLFTLHADADFAKHQEAIDAEIARRAGLG